MVMTALFSPLAVRTCSHCGATIRDEHADECPSCGEKV